MGEGKSNLAYSRNGSIHYQLSALQPMFWIKWSHRPKEQNIPISFCHMPKQKFPTTLETIPIATYLAELAVNAKEFPKKPLQISHAPFAHQRRTCFTKNSCK